MRIGEIIQKYRLERGMSMGDFAKMSGISKPYVSMLEANKNSRDGKKINPSVNTLRKISRAVDIPLDDLFRMLDSEQIINLDTVSDAEELKLLNDYRTLNDNNKSFVSDLIAKLKFSQKVATLL